VNRGGGGKEAGVWEAWFYTVREPLEEWCYK
jgi:hypothetical protein